MEREKKGMIDKGKRETTAVKRRKQRRNEVKERGKTEAVAEMV